MGIVAIATADLQDLSMLTSQSGAAISSTQARTGTYSFQINGTSENISVSCGAADTDWYFRVCLYGVDSTANYQINLRESTTVHVGLSFSTSGGVISAYRNTPSIGTLLGTSSGVTITTGAWFCIEGYVRVNNSTGVVTLKVNGTQVLNLTSQDTQNGGTANWDNIQVNLGGSGITLYIDDIVIRDDTFPGTGGLYVLTPDGDGSDTGWTASTGSRYTCVDEIPPNDADYISTDASASGTKNTFTFSNLGFTPSSIASVSVVEKGKLSVAGTGNIRGIVKSGSTYGNGSTIALGTTSAFGYAHFLTDPDTSAAWSESGVKALSAGVETV